MDKSEQNRTRTSVALATFILLLNWGTAATADVVDDAPEAADYVLLYELPIPDDAAFNYFAVPYSIDTTADFTGGFDRIAYHLELQKTDEERFFVYVSVPAQVLDPDETGVPCTPTGVNIQTLVEDMHVVSNHPQLENLESPLEGSMEFWPWNYVPGNGASVPGATGELYDSGDTPAGDGDYGSMQIHVAGTNQTLFAFNRWGGGFGAPDLGIGNAAPEDSEHSDWTFAANASQYTLKTLRVLVRPGASTTGLSAQVENPEPHQVIQRQSGDLATVPITGTLKVPADSVDGRLIRLDKEGNQVEEGQWEVVNPGPLGITFSGEMTATSGWYRMELRVWKEGEPFDTIVVEPFGIGEVFITSGQSNSANSGGVLLSPEDPRVSAWGPGGWQVANDPQPIATGTGGTPWPALGDLLAARFDVPIGFISVGWGGTRVDQWLPFIPDGLYSRFLQALGEVEAYGARAILWHQGESDAYVGTTAEEYQDRLETVIGATRGDGGWDIPWGVARASFLPDLPPESLAAVIGGQNATIEADPLTFAGPETDDLIGPEWRYDQVHFNEAGLLEHAKRWNDVIQLPPCQGFIPDEDCEEETEDVQDTEDTEDTEDSEDATSEQDANTGDDLSEDTSSADDSLSSPDSSVEEDTEDDEESGENDSSLGGETTGEGEDDAGGDTPREDAERNSEEPGDDTPKDNEGVTPENGGTGAMQENDNEELSSPEPIADEESTSVLEANDDDGGCRTSPSHPAFALMLAMFLWFMRRRTA